VPSTPEQPLQVGAVAHADEDDAHIVMVKTMHTIQLWRQCIYGDDDASRLLTCDAVGRQVMVYRYTHRPVYIL
jgi:hypothetical protein